MALIAATKIPAGAVFGSVAYADATGADSFAADNADGRMVVLLKNTDAANAAAVVFKAGDGLLGGFGDVAVSVPANATVAVPVSRLASARVKNLTGANRGMVLLTETLGTIANLKLAVLSVA